MAKFVFSEEQKKYIKENWGKETPYNMKIKFGCNWYQVVNEAISLGLEAPVSNRWTKEDIETLKELAPKMHYEKIAEKLHKTPNAVYQKARKLTITLIQDSRKWTKEEEKILRNNWGNVKIELLAKRLQRTIFALKVKAVRMGLGPMILNNNDIISISDLMNLFSVSRDMICISWKNKGLIISEVKLTQNKSYMGITIANLWQFLKNNQDIWDSKVLEENILGVEPKWLKEKRKKDLDITYKTYSFWTEEEKSKARFYIKQGRSYEFIAQRVNHTATAVACFLRGEGYVYLLSKYWQTKEIKYVKDNMQKLPTKDIAKNLKRSEASVLYMIETLSYQFYIDEEHDFTLEEDEYLKNNYQKLRNFELANHLQISRNVLINRLKYLNIRGNHHNWSQEEDEYLSQNYNKLTNKELTSHLGLSSATITKHAKELGLKKDWLNDENELLNLYLSGMKISDLAAKYQVSSATIMNRLKKINGYMTRNTRQIYLARKKFLITLKRIVEIKTNKPEAQRLFLKKK